MMFSHTLSLSRVKIKAMKLLTPYIKNPFKSNKRFAQLIQIIAITNRKNQIQLITLEVLLNQNFEICNNLQPFEVSCFSNYAVNLFLHIHLVYDLLNRLYIHNFH